MSKITNDGLTRLTACRHTIPYTTRLHRRSLWRRRPRQFCNSLPSTLRDSSLSLRAFKRRLKTYLFGRGQ